MPDDHLHFERFAVDSDESHRMKPIVTFPFHIQVLHRELIRRKDKNPRYSLRAFATHLEIHPSALSRILAGKQELSIGTSLLIIDKLPLDEAEKMLFIDSLAEEKYRQTVVTLSQAVNLEIEDLKREAEDLCFKNLADSLPDLVWCLSSNASRVTFRNLAFLNYIGADGPCDDSMLSEPSLLNAISAGEAFSGRCKLSNGAGMSAEFDCHHFPVLGEKNKIVCWIGMAKAGFAKG